MIGHPLRHLRVVGVRYRRAIAAMEDERGVDAYAASGVYASATVPFDVVEPAIELTELTGHEVTDVGRLNGQIAEAVAAARRDKSVVLMTGGDCSHATGVIGGLQRAHGAGLRLGLVWFDAHGDFNTPATSPSGRLGGMPVAVAAGLAHPPWRELSDIVSPIPTDRIVLVDVRHLDPAEASLIGATDAVIAAPAPGFPGQDLGKAVDRLAATCDAIYLHIDADILDSLWVPSHGAREPGGPDIGQTITAIETVMKTGKVVCLALVSIYNQGQEGQVSVASGIALLRGGLRAWGEHGTATRM